MPEAKEIVIAGAARTPLGALMGTLSGYTAPQLGEVAVNGALKQAGLPINSVSEVIMGCVLSAGVGMAPARQTVLPTYWGYSIPASTVNKVCGSGMKAIMLGADAIRAGSVEVVVAGGMESMSNAPYLLPKARAGYRMGHRQTIDHMFFDGLQAPFGGDLMGKQAQAMADNRGLARADMDRFALRSLERAKQATQDGSFARETVPVGEGESAVQADELPLKFNPGKIPTLKPAFDPRGTITAATASSIADGASAVVLLDAEAAPKLNAKPLARLVAQAQISRPPADYTEAPVDAISALFQKTGWTAESVDLYEINEAFAMVPMLPIREFGLDEDRVNVLGGACALGHPIGCSGNRIVVTLLNAMRLRQAKRGIAAICIGGGEATALALELY